MLGIFSLILLAPVAGRAETPLNLWSSEEIQLRAESAQRVTPVVSAIAIDPQGQLLATAGDDHLVRIWQLPGGRLRHRLAAHTDWVRSIVFDRHGPWVYSAGNDRRLIRWNLDDGSHQVVADLAMPVTSLAISAKHLAAIGFGGSLMILDLETYEIQKSLKCPCQDMRAVAFSPTGHQVAAGGRNGVIQVWGIEDGSAARRYQAHHGRIRSLLFSADGEQLVSCGEDRRIHVRQLETARPAGHYDLPRRPTKILTMTRWGEWLATGGSDNRIRLWDFEQQREVAVLEGHLGSVAALAATPEMLVSGSFDTSIRLWTMTSQVSTQSR